MESAMVLQHNYSTHANRLKIKLTLFHMFNDSTKLCGCMSFICILFRNGPG